MPTLTAARSPVDDRRRGALLGLAIGDALGAAVELHYLSASLDVLFERIQRRAREDPPMEREAVRGWFEIFQAPTPEEMALFDEHWRVPP